MPNTRGRIVVGVNGTEASSAAVRWGRLPWEQSSVTTLSSNISGRAKADDDLD